MNELTIVYCVCGEVLFRLDQISCGFLAKFVSGLYHCHRYIGGIVKL